MANRTLKADGLFDGYRMHQDVCLVTDDRGGVVDIVPEGAAPEAELFEGILVPGLVNCHCHLELSHLKNAVPEGKGLVPFLISVVRQRGAAEDLKQQQMALAAQELYRNGVVAVADICNTADAVALKKSSPIYWHNLVEVLNFFDEQLPDARERYEKVAAAHMAEGLPAVLTPHAPYSVSIQTLKELNRLTEGRIISMHNQESAAENELFQNGTGLFLQLFDTFLGGRNPVVPTGKSSLQSWLPYFTHGQTILLVHNTFIAETDLRFATDHAAQYGLKLVYCLCPNANLYIEGLLPPVEMLVQHGVQIVLGTDSYSSNHQLDIMSEVKTLKKHFPSLPLTTLLHWATAAGATALGLDMGSFKKGTRPGVILLSEQDFSVQRIF